VDSSNWVEQSRLFIIGIVLVAAVLGFALVILSIGESSPDKAAESSPPKVNALADSENKCVECHRQSTPGIVKQYGKSSMAHVGVSCQDCHSVGEDYPGSQSHEGEYILASPTPKQCQSCHQQEVRQFNQSRHGLPAYVAMWGSDKLSDKHKKMLNSIPEYREGPGHTVRNALFEMEGREITRFACESCHNIGMPRKDGSVGKCQKCHLRHKFSLEQARKPETCNACHIGPDHPQYEIYENSPHGIAYHTDGDNWNWDAEAGTQTTEDFPAPTCATCHMSGFGASGTTHDVGERLTWYLFSPISKRRPAWQSNRARMQNVYSECHNKNFIDTFYAQADSATRKVNHWVRQSDKIKKELEKRDLLTDKPFDEPFDFAHFELWHHWGRTAKFGVWMQGPDYTQWHGAYEVLKELSELREMKREKIHQAEEPKPPEKP
jgi:hypothetical protein